MSKIGKGKHAQKGSEKDVDSQPKGPDSVGERKRKSSSAVATDVGSPLRVAPPVLGAKASSAPAAVVAVEALAERIPIRKKKVEFLNRKLFFD